MANSPRIVDPTKFLLLGAMVDWTAVFRRHKPNLPQPKQIATDRQLDRFRFGEGTPRLDRVVQLRWLLAPDRGYPTRPFTVWRRPAIPAQGEAAVPLTAVNILGLQAFRFDRPRVFIRLTIQATSAGAVFVYAGVPVGSSLVAAQGLTVGFNTVLLSAASIFSLLLSPGATVNAITGLDGSVANDPQWQAIEIVGLPVDPASTGGFASMTKQGLVATLGDPRDAALSRFARGAPFYGWEEQITPLVPAPPWKLAEPKAMLKVMDQSMLKPLRKMVENFPPPVQADFIEQHALPLVGGGAGSDPANAEFHPLQTLLFGAATDPLASLISGFGTAYIDMDLPTINLGDRQLFGNPNRNDWDYMVTAPFDKGADGNSAAIEYAAFVFAPAMAGLPPLPANLSASGDGLRAPLGIDADWNSVARVAWDKLDDNLPFRVGSYAFARAQLAPAGSVQALMDERPFDTALQPISATTSPAQEATGRLLALDERYAVASAPNPNGLLYGLAHQDLFGLWSPWASAPFTVGEPPVRAVSIISARLEVQPQAVGNCPGALVLDFSWEWATRSPRRIELVGRFYAQAKLGAAPANLAVPAGLPLSLAGGPGSVLQIVFNGAAPGTVAVGTPGLAATLQYLDLNGQTFQAMPPTSIGPRRYRLTVTGLQLDYNAAPRIGLALWARAIEQRAPQRVGGWSGAPAVASSADPRPPVLNIEHEDVLLTSLADASGEHHARIDWPAVGGAVGYFVYTCTEEKLRADRGMASALKSLTLSQRLAALRTAFAADPSRRSFTRVNAQPVASTSLPVMLPRGSKEIHLYVVLGLSAGQVESAWPQPGEVNLRKRPIAYAAPQVVVPSPPDLEVSRVLDSAASPPAYRAQLRVRSKPGAPVSRIDLHRVRVPEAALALDTMGPPIARLTGSSGPWVVQPTASPEPGVAQALGTIAGRDAVEGSWKRVFYRAVAWAPDDPTRGLYGGRSAPSAPREVIVPPATPPDLSPLAWAWPGGPLADVQVNATSAAPVAETPLGPHRLQVSVFVDGSPLPLFQHPPAPGDADRLDRLPTTPPAPAAHGLWRDGGGALHLLLRRAAVTDVLRVRWLLSDPLGRSTEQVFVVPAGSPLPAPDILTPKVTKVPGKGFILTFFTTVPVPATSAGPYVLSVLLKPAGVSNSRPLPQIKLTRLGDNPWTELTPVPLRRGAPVPHQGTPLAAFLRGSTGTVQVTLTAPDGRTAKLSRTLT